MGTQSTWALQNKRNVNILLFGFAGSGKSAFVNTVHTMLSEDPGYIVKYLAPEGNSMGHVTKNLTYYPIPNLNITLWDSWGLTKETYQNMELEHILSGMCYSGWKMTNGISKKIVENKC